MNTQVMLIFSVHFLSYKEEHIGYIFVQFDDQKIDLRIIIYYLHYFYC